jgi:pyruvate kinase
MPELELLITQGPYSTFLDQVAAVDVVSGIRLNTIMPIKEGELERKLIELRSKTSPKTLWIDLKAHQLRVVEFANTPYTAVTISRRIRVRLPNTVYFDNGNVTGKLVEIDGNKLILEDYVGRLLGPGESVNIIDESLEYLEPDLLTERDHAYVEQCSKLDIHHYMLSFVEHAQDVGQLKRLDPDAVIMAKLESKRGLRNLVEIGAAADAVMAARGDLYTEIDYPHQIADVMKRIRQVCGDRAVAASRMLGSLLRNPMPSCPDIMDVQFLKEMGYTRFLIGDDICFKKEVLMQAIRIFRAIFSD